MQVHLSFDVEVWCNDWQALDERFPAAYARYVYGSSRHGQYALPKTLEILARHGLQGVFFVEPLFSARFGQQYLKRITDMLLGARQDVQLHLHPEWTDEIRPALLDDVSKKRQHLIYYDYDEQLRLIEFAKQTLEAVTGRPVQAFRAGSYACNADTYRALAAAEIYVDSSFNEVSAVSGRDLPHRPIGVSRNGEVLSFPITVFGDGFGRLRPAQVCACSFGEMRSALLDAHGKGARHFVIVSHNFEMLRGAGSDPDWVVARRFESLCRFLAEHPDKFQVGSYPTSVAFEPAQELRPSVGWWDTTTRYVEQALRRVA